MIFTDKSINILAAITCKKIGKAWIVENINIINKGIVGEIVNRINNEYKKEEEKNKISKEDFERRKKEILDKFEQMRGIVDGVIGFGEKNFPRIRGDVKNSEKPVILFYRGDLSLLDEENNNVAVIGLRDPTEKIVEMEKRLIKVLVEDYGVTIISGLALGCDKIAHEQAIYHGGKTIAILPSPISDILPKSNMVLAEEIVKNGGLLISEYYEREKDKWELSKRYIERDRLQAMFSDCVLLVASYSTNDLGKDSGARHAMKKAKEYNINRAVLWDSEICSDDPEFDMFELNRELKKEHDVKVIDFNDVNVKDIIKECIYSRIRKSLFSE